MPVVGTPITTDSDLPLLCSLADAAVIAAALTAVPSWTSSTDPEKTAALAEATLHVCGAMRYQGRKYDADQELEFPRIDGCTVIDLDADGETAIVPQRVKIATVKQAQAIRSGEIAARKDRIAKGLTSVTTGPFSETYAAPASGGAGSTAQLLTPEAMQLLEKYRLRSGGIR